MRHWFHCNYEDPVENTPYESAERGFIYIWGGPYEPEEALSAEFGGVVRDKVIEELAEELREITREWTGHPDSGDVDDYLYSSIASFTKHLDAFQRSILDIDNLLKTNVAESSQQVLYRLLYVHVITALETYLSDFFISTITADRELLRTFVETNSRFKTQKRPVSDVFKVSEEIEHRVRTYLIRVVWHRLDEVKPMFKDVLGIEFPEGIGGLFNATFIRHDMVHRNGKTKEGTSRTVSRADITGLVKLAEDFVNQIESLWHEVKYNRVCEII